VLYVFLWAKGLDAKDIHQEMFPVCGRKCSLRKRFTAKSRNYLKDVLNSEMMKQRHESG
jgi:hypothetical protein